MQTDDHHNVSAITKYIAGKMTALRTERRWSQLAMAVSCGLHQNQIGKMERGKTNPRVDTMYSIVRAFNISWDEFFKDFDGKKLS